MSLKIFLWTLLAATALASILLFNHWASFQPLSTLAYSGIVMSLAGLANLALPFRFFGIHKRATGALLLAGGVGLAFAGLLWPAHTLRIAQHRSRLDDLMPEYQFNERHSARVHASPEQVMQAVRQSTWGDLKSLNTLMKIRGAALREPYQDTGAFARDKRVLDAFSASGYLLGGSEHEIVMFGVVNVRTMNRPQVRTSQEFVDYREPGALKTAFDFTVEEAGGGWSTLSTETRMFAQGDFTRGPAIYWRLIVPGSGLLRLQWLEGIKRRAESATNPRA